MRLDGLYATGDRRVPAGFVPTKWAGYLVAAEQAGDVTAYRRYWELAVLVGLCDGLRSGDVFMPGSSSTEVPPESEPAAQLTVGELDRGRNPARPEPIKRV